MRLGFATKRFRLIKKYSMNQQHIQIRRRRPRCDGPVYIPSGFTTRVYIYWPGVLTKLINCLKIAIYSGRLIGPIESAKLNIYVKWKHEHQGKQMFRFVAVDGMFVMGGVRYGQYIVLRNNKIWIFEYSHKVRISCGSSNFVIGVFTLIYNLNNRNCKMMVNCKAFHYL